MQLVAYGAQDVYLTGNPQITFWKVVYRRHTNFAVESIEQVFNGTGDFGKKVVCQIQRNGDLITKMYLRLGLPALPVATVSGSSVYAAWVSKIGHAVINSVELNIGGTTIDKHYGDWFNVWYELARNWAQDRGYDKMIGNTEALTTINYSAYQENAGSLTSAGTAAAILYVPLYFFHCRNNGLALPLIATQYHDTRIEFQFNNFNNLIITNSSASNVYPLQSLTYCSLYVDYVYLDTEERKKFAQASHEYLIEQLQFTGAESVTSQNSKFRLNFNHPCKALYWNIQQNQYLKAQNSYLAYNPKNWAQTVEIATKRAAMYAFTGTGTTAAGSSQLAFTSGNFLNGTSNIFYKALEEARVTLVDISGNLTINNLVITGVPLPDWLASLPYSTLFSTTGSYFTATPNVLNVSSNTLVHSVVITPTSDIGNINVQQYDNYGVYLNRTLNPVSQVLLQLNGQDRFSQRDGNYFNYVQPWQHHSNTPCDGINMYSFALNPEEHQPSGTCNMSRIDNATLNLSFITVDPNNQQPVTTTNNSIINIYATNYNVLRIMSGMAGLAYSN